MLESEWDGCTKCEIGEHSRNKVFIDYLPDTPWERGGADIVFIGEGPGQVEDLQGVPFTGPAGQLLREAIALSRGRSEWAYPAFICPYCEGQGVFVGIGETDIVEEVCEWCYGNRTARLALVNLILCRPYQEKPHSGRIREPDYKEVENCMPRLIATLKLLNPTLIVILGREPERYVPGIRHDLLEEGIEVEFDSLQHPSSMLRRGGLKDNPGYQERVNELFQWYWEALMPRVLGKDKDYVIW